MLLQNHSFEISAEFQPTGDQSNAIESLASGHKRKRRSLFPKTKEPLVIPKNNQGLKVVQYARDEAHRFGVAYNRSLRKFS